MTLRAQNKNAPKRFERPQRHRCAIVNILKVVCVLKDVGRRRNAVVAVWIEARSDGEITGSLLIAVDGEMTENQKASVSRYVRQSPTEMTEKQLPFVWRPVFVFD